MSDQQPEVDADEVDQDSESTNQAPAGERPTDPEQSDGQEDRPEYGQG